MQHRGSVRRNPAHVAHGHANSLALQMEEFRTREFFLHEKLIVPVHQGAESVEIYGAEILSRLFSATAYRHVKQRDGAQRKRNYDHCNHLLISSITAWFHCSNWARL